MIKNLLLPFIFLFSFLQAKADQHAVVRKSVAEKTVAFLKTEHQIIFYCGCCSGDKFEKVIISRVTYEQAYPEDEKSRYYRVRVYGFNETTGEDVNRTFDLAYAWINIDGVAKNLAWEMGLNADPCYPSFDWETYKAIKVIPAAIGDNDGIEFEKSFRKIRRSLEAGVGFKVETFESNQDFTVDKVEVKSDHYSKSLVISHFGSGFEQRYTIPLSKVDEVSVNVGSIRFKMKEDGSVTTEEFKETELTYRIFASTQEISIWEPDISLLEDFKTILRTYNSMPEKMVKTTNKAQKVVEVTNLEDFFNAIAPNMHIKLVPGIYHISEMENYPETEYVSWVKIYDGYEPHIDGVSNMTISCSDTAHLLIQPRYAWVLKMENCDQITFKNLVLGHEEGGGCMGGCLGLVRSSQIEIDGCSFYGSGTVGLGLEYVSDLSFKNSLIYECTYHLMQLYSSKNISFTNSVFKDSKEYNLIEINESSSNISYKDCLFDNNETGTSFMEHFFEIGALCEGVSLDNCQFTNNRTGKFVNDFKLISISNCSFVGNSIENITDAVLNTKFND